MRLFRYATEEALLAMDYIIKRGIGAGGAKMVS
jgi:hypothetical protein